MDGYAVVADDTLGANEHSPVVLRVGDSVRLGRGLAGFTPDPKYPTRPTASVMVRN